MANWAESYRTNIRIPKANIIQLSEALPDQYEDVGALFSEEGFSFQISRNGDLTRVMFEGEKPGDLDRLFSFVAPYTKKGSYIELIHESDSGALIDEEVLLVRYTFSDSGYSSTEFGIVLYSGKEISRRELKDASSVNELATHRAKDNKFALDGKLKGQIKLLLDSLSYGINEFIEELTLEGMLGDSYESAMIRLRKVKKDGKIFEPGYYYSDDNLGLTLNCGEFPLLQIDIKDWDCNCEIDFDFIISHMSSQLGLEDEYDFRKKCDLDKALSKAWRWSWKVSSFAICVDLEAKGGLNECDSLKIQVRDYYSELIDSSPKDILQKLTLAAGNDQVFGVEWRAVFEKTKENATETNSGESMAVLYRMLINGNGCQKNDLEAKKWLKRGAELEDLFCLFTLGSDLYYGKNFDRDADNGITYLELAANKGHKKSAKLLKKLGSI